MSPPMGVLDIWRATRKKVDHPFNTYVARPPAAALVMVLRSTPITPNQVTFLSVFMALGAAAVWIALPGYWGGLVGGIGILGSFVVDCADGQLARVRGTQSAIGHHLDFLMDELKAFFIYGSLTVRMYRETADVRVFFVGLGGLVAVASGISLTSFMRRPEYTGETQKAADGVVIAPRAKRTSLIGRLISAIEWGGRQVIHYPQYVVIVAALGRLDIFFFAYAGINALYLARSGLAIMWKLGRFNKAAARP
jgi:phosphatidylglycerophosphate synthase